jgi:chromosomal replication initiator protein
MKNKIDCSRLIIIVCKYYKIKKDDLLIKDRNKKIAYYRQVLFFMMVEYGNLNLSEIGRLMDRNHSTVIYSHEKINEYVKIYKNVSYDIWELIKLKNIPDIVIENVNLLSIAELNNTAKSFLS